MKEHKSFVERLTTAADLSSEPIPGVPLVEIAGLNRVYVENHRGVALYTDTEIQVKVKYGRVRFCGSDLSLSCISNEYLTISGKIDAVYLCKEGG